MNVSQVSENQVINLQNVQSQKFLSLNNERLNNVPRHESRSLERREYENSSQGRQATQATLTRD